MHKFSLTSGPSHFARLNVLRFAVLAALLAAILVYWAWFPLSSPFDSQRLVVMTRQSPTTYYLDADGNPAGFEYDLAAEFARRQGLELKVTVADSVADLLSGVVRNQAHFAAGWLAETSERNGRVRFGPAYANERELVVCGPGIKTPETLGDLAGVRLEVVKGSSHAERLMEVRQAFPALRWLEVGTTSTEELLERVATGLSDCTVADASTFDVIWNYWPKLVVAMALTENRDIAWVLPKNADMRLRQAVADFFRSIREDGWLDRLKERYFGHLRRLDEADVEGILTRRGRFLPELRAHFEHAQGETGLDWRLLAALAYQESQWNASATSPTGVRGIMMLTTETADRLGVSDRLNPAESILAGARYLIMLRDQLPERIPEPDRTWMAMAAYNLGMGHLEDARRLAQALKKNPDAWHDLKDILPLLAKSSYAGRLRLGFARGGEARMLTENVRIYYDILKRFEPAYAGIDSTLFDG
ncbi:MAG: membrane-bound lytic murein transglycosylase MltF [Thiobacillus sp.]|nr:membrane-bound lytic murein transglycosylase MltF [Thiobacillus sp.]